MLIDTHCHLNVPDYNNDRNEVIKRAHDAGIFIIAIGTEKETSLAAIQTAKNNNGVWASVGLDPNHLFTHSDIPEEIRVKNDFDPSVYRDLAMNEKVVAIGECGLEYHYIQNASNIKETKQKQQKILRAHLDLADELDLPLILHCRDAHTEMQKNLKEYIDAGKLERRGVIHCFTGAKAEAGVYTEMDFLIGFTGIITFSARKNQEETLADVVSCVPLNRILIETDAPLLAPVPFRGKRNEPAYVKYVAKKIAEIKQISFDEVAEQTTKNAQKLFRI